MVFYYLELKEMQWNFWQSLSSNPLTSSKRYAFQTWKYGKLEWVVGEFEIHSEFWTHHGDFELVIFFPLMSSKLIWNSSQFQI